MEMTDATAANLPPHTRPEKRAGRGTTLACSTAPCAATPSPL